MTRRLSAITILIVCAASVRAADWDVLPMIAAGRAPAQSSLDAFYRYEPGSREPQSGAAPVISDQRLRARAVLSNTEHDNWTLQQTVGQFNLTESPTIPESNLRVPDSLWDIDTGAAYTHRSSDRRSYGASLSVGSASDRPYYGLREVVVRFSGNYRLPASGDNSWLLFLAYSNNRHFLNNVPLPGFAYVWNHPEKNFVAMAGFPLALVSYRPDPWAFRASVFGPRSLALEASRRVIGPLRAYAGYDWSQQGWLRVGRDDFSSRLIFDEKKTMAGFRSPVGRYLEVDLSGGYAFDRRFFENRSGSASDVPLASLRNSWLFEGRLTWRPGGSPARRSQATRESVPK